MAVLSLRLLVVADVSAEFVHGGAERMLFHHVRALVQAGNRVSVLTRQPTAHADLCIELDHSGLKEHRLPFSGDKGYRGLKQLQSAAKVWWREHNSDFDVVVAEQPFVMWSLMKAGCTLPRLQVCHSFAFEEYQTRHALSFSFKHRVAIFMMKKLEKEVYSSADKLLVLSRFMQQRLQSSFGIKEMLCSVVAGAAEQQQSIHEAKRKQYRDDLNWHTPVITTLRNLVPRTGVDLMIQVAAIVRVVRPDVRWLIMGDGALRESMQNMAAELAVADIVEFSGFISEEAVQQRLLAADIFMVPTRGLEGFGLVTLEANACGLPVLATPIAANSELVPTIHFNQLAENASPLALANKLLWMLEHPLSAEQRKEIQETSRQLYNWQKHDEKFLDLVGDLV